ncbi:glycogenin glucosyltransferase [Coemansia asiatica]|uniref:glycogenin glucosyltransferase n=1 Tax=Coemansia asiatica TaxID=1052880 RepID=A0A9W7XKY8_9FUNG|nr:glycogenin glucosyltransferase [Coemansia asiatica]
MDAAADTAQAQPTDRRFAFVTLVTSDGYVDGALVLLHSLRRTLTPYSIVCLATPSTLSESSMRRLRQHFAGVIETDVRISSDDHGLELLGRPDLSSTLTKIQLWDPALFGAWDALCYMDADTLVRQPIDDVFSRYFAWREDYSQWKEGGLIAASPDTGWPDCFNSGVLLLAPGYGCYQDLVHRTCSLSPSFDGADQGLLNEHFSDWSTAPSYRRLPFLYNSTANIYYTYRPALERFGHEVRVVHFIGVSKPWNWERTPGGQLITDSSTPERWRQLISLWWNIHDENVSGWKFWRGSFSKPIAFGAGYHHIIEPLITATEPANQESQCYSSDGDQSLSVPTSNFGGDQQQINQEHGQQYVHEVPDWDKDWSWADNRVHPLDYAYLKSHNMPSSSQLHQPSQPAQQFHGNNGGNSHHEQNDQEQQQQQQHQHHHYYYHQHNDKKDYHEQPHTASQQEAPYFNASSSVNDNDRSFDVHLHDQSHSDHYGHDQGISQEETHQRTQAPSRSTPPPLPPPPPPAWMQSQRPWEDVAREGWLHQDDYKPHAYDQSYIGRRITDYTHHHHHHHYHNSDNGYSYDHGHGGTGQEHSTQHSGHIADDRFYHQPWTEHHHHHHHGNDDGDHQEWNHPVWYGHNGQPQQYTLMPLPNNRPLYEASQVVLRPHGSGNDSYEHANNDTYYRQQTHHSHGDGGGNDDDDGNKHIEQSSSVRSSRSNTGSSPIHYPQPKSPMVVNPVALWESGEEQARRRAWAQHVREPLGEQQQHQVDSTASIFDNNGSPITDQQQVPPSSIDYIDSSHLPRETPWKISHVRQRQLSNDSANAQSAPRAGMQFKEGVANDGNARDAAGQLLQRWNEAVITRNIKPRLGDISSDQILHSVPMLERGTDAIRLETTVSCEAEDSKGERTVYRFTLSSTLDVGGAQGASISTATVPTQQGQIQQPQPQMEPVAMHVTKQPLRSFDVSNPKLDDGAYNDEEDEDEDKSRSMIVNLRQPVNYQEPAMSRRSSFVQLPPTASARSVRSGPENRDQFAIADARYWKLQRQLIDLEMSQRSQEGIFQQGDKGSMASPSGRIVGSSSWEAQGVDAADLASPPTPTRKPSSFGVEPQSGSRRLVRRSSAFSIADPAIMLENQDPSGTDSAHIIDSSALHGTRDRDRDRDGGKSLSSSRLNLLVTPEQAKPYEPVSRPGPDFISGNTPLIAEARVKSPSQPKRSRSHSALLRIATENRAQAVSSTIATGALAKEQGSPNQRSAAVLQTGPLQAADSGMGSTDDEYRDSDEGSGVEDKDFKSAIGRKPTPFPRSLLNKRGKMPGLSDDTEESEVGEQSQALEANKGKQRVDIHAGGVGKRRAIPHSLNIEPETSGFRPSHYGVSSVSSGAPMTPGRQKIRPLINWGDEDGNDMAPPNDDKSLSAQWLRIVNGAPPPRAPVAPVKAQPTKEKAVEKDNDNGKDNDKQLLISEAIATATAAAADTRSKVVEKAESAIAKNSGIDTLDDADSGEPHVLVSETVKDDNIAKDTERKAVLEDDLIEKNNKGQSKPIHASVPATEPAPAPAPSSETKPATTGTRAPPRKLHSTKSFLNLTSKVYDTVSDSEMDPGELELQERFWARAMKPPKSGTSTPYTPGRRKSIVEMSSAISPRDLEEWMQWQGEGMPAIGRQLDVDLVRAEESGDRESGYSVDSMVTPPTSKERETVPVTNASDSVADEGFSSESAEDADIEDVGDEYNCSHGDNDKEDEDENDYDEDDKLEMQFSHKDKRSDAISLDTNTIDVEALSKVSQSTF